MVPVTFGVYHWSLMTQTMSQGGSLVTRSLSIEKRSTRSDRNFPRHWLFIPKNKWATGMLFPDTIMPYDDTVNDRKRTINKALNKTQRQTVASIDYLTAYRGAAPLFPALYTSSRYVGTITRDCRQSAGRRGESSTAPATGTGRRQLPVTVRAVAATTAEGGSGGSSSSSRNSRSGSKDDDSSSRAGAEQQQHQK